MTSWSTMRRWARWGAGEAVVLKRPLASFAVPRLARELHGDESSWAASALVRTAVRFRRPAADRALEALIEACNDTRAAGNVFYECLLQCTGKDDVYDRRWSSVAAPVLLGGSPPRLVRFLDSEPVGDKSRTRPTDIVERLLSEVTFGRSPRRRPELERFLSTTDQPLILGALAAQWAGNRSVPNRVVTEVTVANPHLVPAGPGDSPLLAVAKDRLDLLDLTRKGTVAALVRGTELPRADLADRCRRVLRALPPGVAQEYLCKLVIASSSSDTEAAEAAIDAAYVPKRKRDRVVFLHLTEQWDRYDAVDPDGELLYAAYLRLRSSTDHEAQRLRERIGHTARRNRRPDPDARFFRENPPPKSRKSDRRPGPTGGYSSDYGGGDYGGSGGWTGGSF